MNQEELSAKEKELFAGLERETPPPAGLEQKIRTALTERKLIRSRPSHWIRYATGVAAAVMLFAAGLFYGKSTMTTMNTINPEKGYILLLHEDNSFQPGEPMEMFQEYSEWMERTQEGGVRITGQELSPEGMVVDKSASTPASMEERTTGYFLIEAASMEEALSIARDNPHVKYGGKIEIKPFMVR